MLVAASENDLDYPHSVRFARSGCEACIDRTFEVADASTTDSD
jgi:hypothetical protein